MKTLEQIKKEKNYTAHIKGCEIDPERFSFRYLLGRLNDEYNELLIKTIDKFDDSLIPESQFIYNDNILEELADMSNFIDYIATKIIVNYPTKYNPEITEG